MKSNIQGTYNNYPIKLGIFRTKKKTNLIFLNVHGTFGESGDKGSKSEILGKLLLKDDLANVVQYSSSRNWQKFISIDKVSRNQAFSGKTFDEERLDLINAIDYIVNNSQKLFNISKDDLRLYVVAFSLGGTLVSTLNEKLKLIDKLVICGSGIEPSSFTKTLFPTFYSKEVIQNSIKNFNGRLLSLRGSLDDTITFDSQKELFDSYKFAESKEWKVIEGANHTLSSINGEDKELAYSLFIEEVMNFFSSSELEQV